MCVDDFKMAGPEKNLPRDGILSVPRLAWIRQRPWEGILAVRVSKQSSLRRAGHPFSFSHVFDESLRDPSAMKAAAAAVQDFNEYYPDEGIVARHHLQPRKALYRPSGPRLGPFG